MWSVRHFPPYLPAAGITWSMKMLQQNPTKFLQQPGISIFKLVQQKSQDMGQNHVPFEIYDFIKIKYLQKLDQLMRISFCRKLIKCWSYQGTFFSFFGTKISKGKVYETNKSKLKAFMARNKDVENKMLIFCLEWSLWNTPNKDILGGKGKFTFSENI